VLFILSRTVTLDNVVRKVCGLKILFVIMITLQRKKKIPTLSISLSFGAFLRQRDENNKFIKEFFFLLFNFHDIPLFFYWDVCALEQISIKSFQGR
jgi:hypothetical protein